MSRGNPGRRRSTATSSTSSRRTRTPCRRSATTSAISGSGASFMVALAKADLRGSNSNTLLGEIWGVLDPLFQAAIYLFLITVIRGGRGGADAAQTATMIIAGVFLFSYTRAALIDGGRSIVTSKVVDAQLLVSTRAVSHSPRSTRGSSSSCRASRVYAVIHIVTRRPIGQGVFLLPLLFVLQTIMGIGNRALGFDSSCLRPRHGQPAELRHSCPDLHDSRHLSGSRPSARRCAQSSRSTRCSRSSPHTRRLCSVGSRLRHKWS